MSRSTSRLSVRAVLLATIITMASIELDIPLNVHAFDQQQAILQLPAPSYYTHASLPVPNATRSFWIHNLDKDQTPRLDEGSEGELSGDADVCIVGSGITGTSAAYHLANLFAESSEVDGQEKKLKVVMLEAREFCQHFAWLWHDSIY